MMEQNQKKRRPVWIWVISIFYFGFGISGLMAIAMALIIHTQGAGPAGEIASLDDLMRSSLWGILPAANIAGAVSLFLMRRIAFAIFSGLLAAKIALQMFFETPLSNAISGGGGSANMEMILGYGLGYIILLAVCIYARHLKKTGILK
ncbi:MAG: hypothetical protein K9K82_00485 [Desulfobacteraceae bacterium]|nr:hypothetical protein [Desulfobacteraceae bacterium]